MSFPYSSLIPFAIVAIVLISAIYFQIKRKKAIQEYANKRGYHLEQKSIRNDEGFKVLGDKKFTYYTQTNKITFSKESHAFEIYDLTISRGRSNVAFGVVKIKLSKTLPKFALKHKKGFFYTKFDMPKSKLTSETFKIYGEEDIQNTITPSVIQFLDNTDFCHKTIIYCDKTHLYYGENKLFKPEKNDEKLVFAKKILSQFE